MLKYGNKEYRNLQEQVYKNTTDIAAIVPGTSAYGVVFEYVVETAADLPEATKENTFAFVKDENAIYVSEKHDDVIEWVDTGVKIGTGPQGPKGDTGPTGPKGDKGDSGVYVGADEPPANYDVWIDLQGNPVEYQPKLTAGQNITIIDNVISATGELASASWGQITGDIESQTDLMGKIEGLQDKLVAGQGINISGNVISATGGGGGPEYTAGYGINIDNNEISINQTTTATHSYVDYAVANKVSQAAMEDYVQEALVGKQDELVAGQNITISGNVISATGGSGEPIEYIKRTTISPDGKSLTIVKNNDTSTVFSPAFQAEHDVFVCRRGVTPFSEILTAYMADKEIVMIDPDGNDSSFYQLSRAVAGGGSVSEFQFTKVEGFTAGTGKFKLKNYSLYSNNFWQYTEKTIDDIQETTYYGGSGIDVNQSTKTISIDNTVAKLDGNRVFYGGNKEFQWSGTNPPLTISSDTRDDSIDIACDKIRFSMIDNNGSWSIYNAKGYSRTWVDEGIQGNFQFPHMSGYNTIAAAPMPANDGTYTLRLVMENGLPRMTWISNT